jgi:hypothetical protein
VLAYGATRAEAVARAKALALRVLAERLEHGEPTGELDGLFEAPEPLAGDQGETRAGSAPAARLADQAAVRGTPVSGTQGLGPMSCSHSTTTKNSGRACWRGSPSILA